MTDRKNQVWAEDARIFMIIGPPADHPESTEGFELALHPIVWLPSGEQDFLEEGDITWENQPYMVRIA